MYVRSSSSKWRSGEHNSGYLLAEIIHIRKFEPKCKFGIRGRFISRSFTQPPTAVFIAQFPDLCINIVLYFRTAHVVIFILFKPTHALFLKHIHIHIQQFSVLNVNVNVF